MRRGFSRPSGMKNRPLCDFSFWIDDGGRLFAKNGISGVFLRS